MIVGLLHPGEMGSAVGAALRGLGHDVIWASEGRSGATRARAASFRDAGTVSGLLAEAEIVLSICPPHAALDVARACAGFAGIYVDANAISPSRAREVGALHTQFVDRGIVGGPPTGPGTTLYLTGSRAQEVSALFAGSALATRVVGDEWRLAAPDLAERLPRAEAAAAKKGWRWTGEMDEIADTFAAAGAPAGFHRAAAEVFRP